MAEYKVTDTELKSIADAIRARGGTTAAMSFPNGFVSAVEDVPNTYTSADEGKVVSNNQLVSQTSATITANGTHDTTLNNSVTVNVAGGITVADEGKVVVNGELVAQTPTNITANGTYDTTLHNSATVSVPNSYAAGDEGKVVSNGALVAQGSQTITENGTYDTTLISELIAHIEGCDDPFALKDYIASNGTQYIDTGYKLTANSWIEMVANITNTYGTPVFFGIRNADNSGSFWVGKSQNLSVIQDAHGSSGTNYKSGSLDMLGTKSVIKKSNSGSQMFTETFQCDGYDYSASTPTNALNLYIFALNTGGTIQVPTTMNLYRFRIYEGDALVHDFVPWTDTEDVVCLKDTITGNLLYNAGSGVFTRGQDV